jgi:hypothetical protein
MGRLGSTGRTRSVTSADAPPVGRSARRLYAALRMSLRRGETFERPPVDPSRPMFSGGSGVYSASDGAGRVSAQRVPDTPSDVICAAGSQAESRPAPAARTRASPPERGAHARIATCTRGSARGIATCTRGAPAGSRPAPAARTRASPPVPAARPRDRDLYPRPAREHRHLHPRRARDHRHLHPGAPAGSRPRTRGSIPGRSTARSSCA